MRGIKVLLHLHVDGSLTPEVVAALLIAQGKMFESWDDLKAQLQAPAECNSLEEYLTRFDLPCSVLQDPTSMYFAVEQLLEALANEGVKYVELRFAPQLHSLQYQASEKLRLVHERAIVEAAIQAANWATGIKANFILCCMRNLPDKERLGYDPNYNTLKLAKEFLGKGVVAVDLAGAEARDETAQFERLFMTAGDMGIPFTIHAGEAGDSAEWRINSIKSALSFGAKRIGHGIALENSPELRKFCKENRIGIECCPISNLQTKAVVGGIQNHPLPMFLNEGLLVSVNTDNRTVSNTNLDKEFELLAEVGIGETEQKQLMLNAIEMSFADEETKAWLRTFID